MLCLPFQSQSGDTQAALTASWLQCVGIAHGMLAQPAESNEGESQDAYVSAMFRLGQSDEAGHVHTEVLSARSDFQELGV